MSISRNLKAVQNSIFPRLCRHKSPVLRDLKAPKISPSPDFYKKLTVFTFYSELCVTHSIVWQK